MTKQSKATTTETGKSATANVSGLINYAFDQAKQAEQMAVVILREIAEKLAFFNCDATNWQAILLSSSFAKASRTYNANRMVEVAKKLATKEAQRKLSRADWQMDSDGKFFLTFADVFRITDVTEKGKKLTLSARYGNTFNTYWSIVLAWIEADAQSAFRAISGDDIDMEAFAAWRKKYRIANAPQKAEKAEKADDDIDIEDASERMIEFRNKIMSIVRMLNGHDEGITVKEWESLTKTLDEYVRVVKTVCATADERLKEAEDQSEEEAAA